MSLDVSRFESDFKLFFAALINGSDEGASDEKTRPLLELEIVESD
jgi:hypothetical protein